MSFNRYSSDSIINSLRILTDGFVHIRICLKMIIDFYINSSTVSHKMINDIYYANRSKKRNEHVLNKIAIMTAANLYMLSGAYFRQSFFPLPDSALWPLKYATYATLLFVVLCCNWDFQKPINEKIYDVIYVIFCALALSELFYFIYKLYLISQTTSAFILLLHTPEFWMLIACFFGRYPRLSQLGRLLYIRVLLGIAYICQIYYTADLFCNYMQIPYMFSYSIGYIVCLAAAIALGVFMTFFTKEYVPENVYPLLLLLTNLSLCSSEWILMLEV